MKMKMAACGQRAQRRTGATHGAPSRPVAGRRWRLPILPLASVLLLAGTGGVATADDDDHERDRRDRHHSRLDIDYASWDSRRERLQVRGDRSRDTRVTVVNADDPSQVLGADDDDDRDWRVRARDPSPVPCRVRAITDRGEVKEARVHHAPDDCGGEPPPAENEAPTADAGADQSLQLASGAATMQATLDGSGSSDADGDVVAWTWSGSPDPADVESPIVELGEGTHVFTLVVTDDDGADSASDSVTITVEAAPPPPNEPPTADAGADQSLTLPSGAATMQVTLDGSGSSDADGDVVAWAWSGSPDPADVESPIVDLGEGTHVFTLVVTDDDGADSGSDSVTVTVSAPVPGDPHAGINAYVGPRTCVTCHEEEAYQMHGSVHYQQSGPTPNATNIPGPAGERWHGAPGEGFSGINTYCGAHETSPRFTCAGCHVGNGRFPKTPEEFAGLDDAGQLKELSNIDCMTCHQEVYKRFPDPSAPFADLEIVSPGLDGKPDPSAPPILRTGLEGIPVVDPVTMDFDFVPADPTNPDLAGAPVPMMPVSAVEAARTVHPTTRQSCLNCHAGAGGGDGTKRGDMSTALIDPSTHVDVHMSGDGADLVCADCHAAGGHRVVGRGVDLRPNDVPERLMCSDCHGERPHGDYDSRDGRARDTHAERVACQTCHIPTFAKEVPTEVSRDWEDPHYSDAACNGRGGWLPREDKAGDLVPSYQWFDGTSEVYYLTEPLTDVPQVPLTNDEASRLGLVAGSNAYVLGMPNGDVASPDAKLTPMKEHLGKVARNLSTNTLVAHSTFEFFRTGDFQRAILSGMEQTPGMSANDPYEIVGVHTYQSINHGVEPQDDALACGACHASLSGGPVRMDLQGQLGYELKGPESQVCRQCHGQKEDMSFVKLHDKHVKDKRRDCSTCHNFSRPERGLSTRIGD